MIDLGKKTTLPDPKLNAYMTTQKPKIFARTIKMERQNLEDADVYDTQSRSQRRVGK
jgi:hypothetical protein